MFYYYINYCVFRDSQILIKQFYTIIMPKNLVIWVNAHEEPEKYLTIYYQLYIGSYRNANKATSSYYNKYLKYRSAE